MRLYTAGLLALSIPVMLSFQLDKTSNENETAVTCDCNSDKLEKRENKIYLKESQQLFTGTCSQPETVYWISLVKKKKLSAPVQKMVNGRLGFNTYSNGELVTHKQQYLSGANASEKQFSGVSAKGNPLQHGIQTAWFESGAVSYQGSFEKGLPVGTHTFWNQSGEISEKINIVSSKSFEDVSGFHFSCEVAAEILTFNLDGKSSVQKIKAVWTDEDGLIQKELIGNHPKETSPGVIRN
jgi:hypothetical protein